MLEKLQQYYQKRELLREKEVNRKLNKLLSLSDELTKRRMEENARRQKLRLQAKEQENELRYLGESIEKKHQERYFFFSLIFNLWKQQLIYFFMMFFLYLICYYIYLYFQL